MTACISSTVTKPAGYIVKFDDLRTSVGVKNITPFRTTGKFTTEVEGLYLVSASIHTTTTFGYYHIYKNDIIIVTNIFNYIATSDTIETTGTIVAAVELQVGDTVRIQTVHSMTIYDGERSCLTIAKLN